MIRPDVLTSTVPHGPGSCRGCDIWDALCAAMAGDTETLGDLFERAPDLSRCAYDGTQPIHLAVREGHLDTVRLLLAAGADPAADRLGDDLVTMARDRGHHDIAQLLDDARGRLARAQASTEAEDPPIHRAAAANDLTELRAHLDADPDLVFRGDLSGATPLHRAVTVAAHEAIDLLLERGANIHQRHGAGRATDRGYPPVDFQAIDLALWSSPFWNLRGDVETARRLIDKGADVDIVIASALGDIEQVQQILKANPECVDAARPCGKRALSSAVEFGHPSIVHLLLEHGANPNAAEGETAPRGVALHAAARTGHRSLVELLLAHGADPNSTIDSSGSATYAAQNPELRALLIEQGGHLDPYDLVWLGEDDEAVRRITEDPRTAHAGCGGVLAAACTLGRQDLLVRLLSAGARVAPVVTGCRSYLLSDPDMLGLLLDSGMDPNLPNWMHATALHDLCGRDSRGRPRPNARACAALLVDAGATLSPRDEDYRSTPLAWAARNDLPDMVEWLLARGAPLYLPDDEPWATPLAWAERRQNSRCVELLRVAKEH